MTEVTGPIVATSLVIVAVFVPIAFISGLTGMFYRQFALTIAIATVISTINSLTLSPALSAILLRDRRARPDGLTRVMNFLFGWFFRLFNRFFRRTTETYAGSVGVFVRRKGVMMALYAALIGVTYWGFQLVPPGFVPAQDKQYLISFAQLPQGATLERTEAVIKRISEVALQEDGVDGAVAFPGLSINGFVTSSSAGIVFVTLDPFETRRDPAKSAFAIANRLQQKYFAIDDAFVAILPPPPVMGLGTVGGFKLQVEDRTSRGDAALSDVMNQVLAKARMAPELTGVFSSYNINAPQLEAQLDRIKANQLGIPVDEVFRTMQAYLGSLYVNDFNQFGRTYQVIAQADKRFRSTPEDIQRLQTRNVQGQMVPLGSVLTVKESFGPETAMRYNAFRSADLTGNPAPGYSSGQAQEKITQILNETLPQGFDFEWTELTYQQILAGDTAILVFPLCLLLVFLVLAAQYESLTLPLSVILIVPMSMLAAIFGVYFTGGDNNIFTQISLFVLAGLASKNAILIVEFARELERRGRTTIEAAVEASRLRLRPILMTSFAFIMGVVPLAFSHGAGAEMRQAIGIAVLWGMLGVTFFGLILTPVFYVLVRRFDLWRESRKPEPASADPAPAPGE
jgi:multidrug efflux pump